MAGKKISELTAAEALANSDVFPVSTNSETLKASYQLLKRSIIGNGDISTLGASVTAAINALNAGKQNALTFDQTPIAGSTNPVTSGGVAVSLAGKQDALTFDSTPTASSGNPVTSNGVYAAIQAVLDTLHPVGSIYLSVSADDPSTLFGGTWVRIQDTFLLAAGTTYAAGATGGEAMHTLSIEEMPQHQHSFKNGGQSLPKGDTYNRPTNVATYSGTDSYQSSPRGGSQPHNNMPPYVAVYVWKRTA